MTERNAYYAARNAATRIEIFDELSPLAEAALRSFFRRIGSPHVMDEIVLPLLSEGDSQIFAAVRDRPWPPWGLGARNVVAMMQTHLVAHMLRETGFEATEDVFLTEAARYFTYRIPVAHLMRQLGLADTDTVDVMAGLLSPTLYARNAAYHHTIHAASRADWTIDKPMVGSEMTRLVRGGHYSKPGGVPTGSGRFEVVNTLNEVALMVREFLTRDEQHHLLEHVLKSVHDFRPGTIVESGAGSPTINERVRRSLTLDDLGPFQKLFTDRIKQHLETALARLGHQSFPIGSIELQATASGDGDYFRIHRDSDGTDTRELTFVYMFSSEPRKFSGGELRIFETSLVDGRMVPTDRSQTIMPRSNVAVIFPSRHEHEVLPVRVPGKKFDDGRFSITGWVHRR